VTVLKWEYSEGLIQTLKFKLKEFIFEFQLKHFIMKRSSLILALFFVASSLLAQKKIKVDESSERIGGGNNNALVVTIYEATPEQIEKDIKSLMKDYGAKVSSQDGGLFGDNAIIKSMGNNTLDIYAKWEKIKDGETKVIIAFDLIGAFLSSSKHSEQFKIAKDIVDNFANKTTKAAMAGLVKTEQKAFDKLADQQKDLEKDKKNLEEDVESYKQKIEDYNTKIKKAQDDTELNKKNQEAKKKEMEAQQKILDAAKAKEKAVD